MDSNTYKNQGTLVVIEDDAIGRELLRCYIERFGYKALVFDEAQMALDYMKDHRRKDILAVVTDMLMDHTDGLEVISQIRDLPEWRHIPIVVCSGVRKDIYHDILTSFNVSGFLSKPVSYNDFKSLFRSVITSYD